jgi:hypothetical protein
MITKVGPGFHNLPIPAPLTFQYFLIKSFVLPSYVNWALRPRILPKFRSFCILPLPVRHVSAFSSPSFRSIFTAYHVSACTMPLVLRHLRGRRFPNRRLRHCRRDSSFRGLLSTLNCRLSTSALSPLECAVPKKGGGGDGRFFARQSRSNSKFASWAPFRSRILPPRGSVFSESLRYLFPLSSTPHGARSQITTHLAVGSLRLRERWGTVNSGP